MESRILVLGALGNVGAELVQALLRRGLAVRAADRDADRVRERFGPGVEAVRFDFLDPESFGPAFAGVRRMFLLRPPAIAKVERDMYPAIRAAQAAGVERVAFLSLIGIEENRVVPHYKVEEFLRASGQDYRFLRSSFFMQNLSTTHREEIRLRDEIYVPVGRAKTSFIDVRDIAEAAAVVLTDEGPGRKAYDLTGPESLGYEEVARLFSEVLGRPIRYADPAPAAFFLRQLRSGKGLGFALVTTWLYSGTRGGMADRLSGDLEALIGRKGIAMRQFVEDRRGLWAR